MAHGVWRPGSAQYALETGQRRIRLLTENLLATQRRDADLERELQELKALNETLELLALVASKTDNGVVILDAQGLRRMGQRQFLPDGGHRGPSNSRPVAGGHAV